jgi:tight adherence protein C
MVVDAAHRRESVVIVTASTVAIVALVGAALRPRHGRPISPIATGDAPATAPSARSWASLGPVLARRRDRRATDRIWPDAIELLVHALEAGLTPRQAVEHLVGRAPEPLRPAFAAVVHRGERGQPFADALRALPDLLGARAASIADTIGTCDRYGLPLAPVLDQLARDARDARRRLDQAAARKLPVRLSFPLVTCTLPSFVLLAIAPAVIAALSSLGASAW